MKHGLLAAFAACAIALGAGCRGTPCEEFLAVANEGRYSGGGALGPNKLVAVSMQVSPKTVVVAFTSPDGARLRATYLVRKKTMR